jgi:hypothetical protein
MTADNITELYIRVVQHLFQHNLKILHYRYI